MLIKPITVVMIAKKAHHISGHVVEIVGNIVLRYVNCITQTKTMNKHVT